MGRRIKLREEDPFEDRVILRRVKDDRLTASKIKTKDDLRTIIPNRYDRIEGAVGASIRRKGLAEYEIDGDLKINSARVKAEAQTIKDETLHARFYPQEELDKELDDIARVHGVSRKKARNIRAREQQVRAQAVLTAAKAGKVDIDSYTKGLLNNYARGDYEQAIYGNVDETTGKRTYARGRYFTELGFDDAERKRQRGAGTTVNTAAARAERRRDFIQNVQLANFGPADNARASFANRNETQKRESRFAFVRQAEEPRSDRFTIKDDDIPF